MAHDLRVHARRQLGCFTHAQARDAGIDEREVERRIARGAWEEVAAGVYRAAPAASISREQRLMALTLSVDGVAFGRSAAWLYGLLPAPRHPEVLVVRVDRNRLRDGLHSTRSLPTAEIARVKGIRATIPTRTVIDAAGTLAQSAVVRLVDRAVVRRLVRPSSLWRRAIELQNSKRPGCRKVLSALASQHAGLVSARNEWEAQLLRMVDEAGLPEPVPNHGLVLDGQRRFLDIAWPDHMVDLEFDGFEPHMVRAVFDDDRVRQNALVAAGWTVFRVTSRMLEHQPGRLLAAIASDDRGPWARKPTHTSGLVTTVPRRSHDGPATSHDGQRSTRSCSGVVLPGDAWRRAASFARRCRVALIGVPTSCFRPSMTISPFR